MIRLNFKFSDEFNEVKDSAELRSMSEIDLRYGAACGDLLMSINGVDCSARWGWIPMLDLAVALHDICKSLSTSQHAVEEFEFTESDATITFKRDGEYVLVTVSYTPCSEQVAFEELSKSIGEFCGDVFRKSVICFPSLNENIEFQKLRERAVATS